MINTKTQNELKAVAKRLNYSSLRILPAPNKNITEQQVAEDVLFLLKEIENPTGASKLIFTTKGK